MATVVLGWTGDDAAGGPAPWGSRGGASGTSIAVLEDTLPKLARRGSLVRHTTLVEEDLVMVAQYEHSPDLPADGVELLTA